MVSMISPGFKRVITFCFAIIFLQFLTASPKLHCEPQNSGTKYLRNFSRKEYKNQSQNWAAVQDKRGIIYVVNHDGVMEFDGVSWREIRVPNKIVRSLAIDDKGIIYVGGINEIGFLAPDSEKTLKYVSLLDYLNQKYRNFSNVWRTHAAKEGVYFCTSKYLFLWDYEKIIKIAEADSYFAAPFLCEGKLYARQNGTGLMTVKKDSLELIPGGEAYASESIYMLAKYAPG
ncbi:hypothetical protein ACFLRB_02480 [Acidobacteriota bacterium]